MGLDVPVRVVDDAGAAAAVFAYGPAGAAGTARRAAPIPGQPNPANAAAVVGSIERATALWRSGEASAMVTNPINKAALYQAGFHYPGHTEFLAALTGATGQQIMMLASPMLRVVPVTVHASLRDFDRDADDRDDRRRRPHDGGGAAARFRYRGASAGDRRAQPARRASRVRWATEETTLIQPAIEALRADGIDVSGPWPPDTMFTASGAEAVRRGDLHVSRSGADPAEDAGHGSRRQCDAGAADRADLAGSRHRVRHRRQGAGRSDQPDRRYPAGGVTGEAAGWGRCLIV